MGLRRYLIGGLVIAGTAVGLPACGGKSEVDQAGDRLDQAFCEHYHSACDQDDDFR
jgi:hypothetical protein